jgi:hypothetical protein
LIRKINSNDATHSRSKIPKSFNVGNLKDPFLTHLPKSPPDTTVMAIQNPRTEKAVIAEKRLAASIKITAEEARVTAARTYPARQPKEGNLVR